MRGRGEFPFEKAFDEGKEGGGGPFFYFLPQIMAHDEEGVEVITTVFLKVVMRHSRGS